MIKDRDRKVCQGQGAIREDCLIIELYREEI